MHSLLPVTLPPVIVGNRCSTGLSLLKVFWSIWPHLKQCELKSFFLNQCLLLAQRTNACYIYLYIYFVTYRLICVVLVWGSPNLVLGCFIVVLGFPGIIDFSIFQNPVPTSKRFFYKHKHDRKHIDQKAAPSLIAQFLSFASVG